MGRLTHASCRRRLAPDKADTVDTDGRSLKPDAVAGRLPPVVRRRRTDEDVAAVPARRVRSQFAASRRVIVIDDVDIG